MIRAHQYNISKFSVHGDKVGRSQILDMLGWEEAERLISGEDLGLLILALVADDLALLMLWPQPGLAFHSRVASFTDSAANLG